MKHRRTKKELEEEQKQKEEKEKIEKLKRNKVKYCYLKTKKVLYCILENKFYTAFMTIVTIYALFGDDFRLLIFRKGADAYFYGLSTASLLFFSIEILIASISKAGYFIGFYFWPDLVSTVSLITDIGWVMDPIMGGGDFEAGDAEQASQLARAGRGARVGTKASRIIRIIRLIRLIRIVKLYKQAKLA